MESKSLIIQTEIRNYRLIDRTALKEPKPRKPVVETHYEYRLAFVDRFLHEERHVVPFISTASIAQSTAMDPDPNGQTSIVLHTTQSNDVEGESSLSSCWNIVCVKHWKE